MIGQGERMANRAGIVFSIAKMLDAGPFFFVGWMARSRLTPFATSQIRQVRHPCTDPHDAGLPPFRRPE